MKHLTLLNTSFLIGGSIVVLLLFLGSTNPNFIQLEYLLASPSFEEPFGYDELGRSVLSRVINGSYVAFEIAITVMIFSLVIGSTIGLISGYFGGWLDHVLMRIVDIFLAFPGLLLAIALAGILGPGVNNLIIALVAVSWVGYARLLRAQTLSLKSREHVYAAKTLGVPTVTIWWRHILPLAGSSLIIEATFGFAGAILSEAGLSFLGLGVQPPNPSWGQMIREGARYMLVAPHLVIFPSLALWVSVWGINTIGDKLRNRLQIHTKKMI